MPIPAIVGAGIATGVGALLQSIINANAQRKSNETNIRLARQQADWNLQQWERQNAYNDPSAQMQRLQGAKLNPRLLYGSSPGAAAGNAGDVSGFTRAENKSVQLGNLGFEHIADGLQKQVQTDNLKLQQEVYIQDALLKASNVMKTNAETANKTFDFNLKKDLRDFNVDFKRHTVDKLAAESSMAQINSAVAEKTKNIRIQRAQKELDLAISKYRGQELTNEISRITRDLNKVGISWNDPKWIRMLQANGVLDTFNSGASQYFNNPFSKPKWMQFGKF